MRASALGIARKAGCGVDDVLDAWPVERLLDWLRERRESRLD